jgi:hypothetical protein
MLKEMFRVFDVASNHALFLTVSGNSQENFIFPWWFSKIDKEIWNFLEVLTTHQGTYISLVLTTTANKMTYAKSNTLPVALRD